MRANRRRDTTPELRLRRALHAMGLRYRVDALLPLPEVRRRADIVFYKRRVAVFVDGCWWHACPSHGETPQRNSGWWREKLEGNVRRDRDTDARLTDAGWLSIRVWEHEEPAEAAVRVAEAIRSRQR